MPFDANLVLIDGTIVMTATTDTAPTSAATRNTATGAVVIDLKETGRFGLVAVLVCPADLSAGADAATLTGYIECSDAVAFGSFVERHGSWGVANTTMGVIVGDECPCVAFIRFATRKRYCRANITVSASFGSPIVLISPYPFGYL